MAYVARKNKAAEAARTRQAPPAGTTEFSTQDQPTQPQDAWPADGQQGWPEKGWEQDLASAGGGEEAEKERKNQW